MMHSRTNHFQWILAFFLFFSSTASAGALKQAQQAFQKGQLRAAQTYMSKLSPQEATTAKAAWLQGHIWYAQRQYKRAAQSYQQALPNSPKKYKTWLYNNLGNSYFKQKQWRRAIKAYSQALSISPKYERARYNLELALNQRKKQQKPPPPPPRNRKKQQKPPPPPKTKKKKAKKPPKQQKRGIKSKNPRLRMPKANRFKLQPFDRFLPYWRLLRHHKNQKKANQK